MTNCDLTAGRTAKCKNSVGGITKIFYGNWEDWSFEIDETTDELTDVNDGAETPAAVTLYEWDVKGATSLVETPNVSVDNGTAFWEQVLTAQFKKLDAETRKELKLLTYGRVRAFVQDNNGNVFLVGKDFGLDVSGGAIQTGANMEDLSGYQIIQTGREKEPAHMVQAATLEDPFGGLTTPPTIIAGI